MLPRSPEPGSSAPARNGDRLVLPSAPSLACSG